MVPVWMPLAPMMRLILGGKGYPGLRAPALTIRAMVLPRNDCPLLSARSTGKTQNSIKTQAMQDMSTPRHEDAKAEA